MEFPFIIGITLGILVLLLLIFIIFRKKLNRMNYYGFFIMGVIWLPSGILTKNYPLAVMGLVFTVLGLAKRKEWKKRRSWKEMSEKERKTVTVMMVILLALVLVGIVFFFLSESSTNTISGTQELILDEEDLQQLGMTGHGCQTEEGYSNIVDSSLGQYSFCNYSINSLKDTEVIVQLQKFANLEALDGAYQYDSSHLYSIEGLISENDYGDKSRFRVNNVNDYMGNLNEPGVYFYHLWICKDKYLIHITSGGRSEEAKDYIARIGEKILSKFG